MPLNVAEIVTAYDTGRSTYRSWRKSPTQATASGIWFDLSMSPGNPVPNYYAATPAVAVALARSTDGGIDHGPNVTPYSKYLHKLCISNATATAVPCQLVLCDYLIYYPFVDMSTVGDQALTTSIALPRYPTGEGVRVMAVEVASQVGSAQFNFTYTNSDGVSGRVTPTVICNSQTVNGTLVTSATATAGATGPFIPLQSEDKGLRSIETVTFLSGDVGLLALVLVKPLATITLYETTAPIEVDFVIDRAGQIPRIVDDAYLNFICHPPGTLAASVFHGDISTFWSN